MGDFVQKVVQYLQYILSVYITFTHRKFEDNVAVLAFVKFIFRGVQWHECEVPNIAVVSIICGRVFIL
jgi:hypothetical protein